MIEPTVPSAFSFVVTGVPVPKGRPRTFTDAEDRTRTITPRATKDYQERVQWGARFGRVRPIEGDVSISLSFFGGRGDWDNLAKTVCDALNGIAYDDDVQIVEAHVYIDRSSTNPRCEVTIAPAEASA